MALTKAQLIDLNANEMIIDLDGDTMRAANPDSAIDKLDLDLQVSIPTQKVTIPLDGSSLGGLGLTIRFGSLQFKELEANIVQGFPSVPQDQEMPQGFKGATIADVRLALIMKSQIKLPVRMNMDFAGVDVFGDTTRMNFAIDTIGYPPTDLDTSMTVIELNEIGLEPKEKISGNLKFVPISLELEEGYEHWLGFDNYYSLSRYNRSKLYVMAVIEFSRSLSIYL